MPIAHPENVLAAVTHFDPYPFYAALVTDKPLDYDSTLKLWVAASSEAVTAVLTHEACHVRPASEPVPKALIGSTAGRIFRALVRMNDGQNHCPLKRAVTTTLNGLNVESAFKNSRHWAAHLLDAHRQDFAFQLPSYVVANLLGVPAADLADVSRWIGDFVYCLSPISSGAQIEQGKQASDALFALFQRLLASDGSGLLYQLRDDLAAQGVDDVDVVVANAIGFISQSYEATAGLIGNGLLTLAKYPELYRQIAANRSLLTPFIAEVARYDAPVQNTRRFLAADAVIGGQAMKAGDAVLVLLAAANHDPAANPQPHEFDLRRDKPTCFTFGLGVHACPGQSLALVIAQAAVEQMIDSGYPIHNMPTQVGYRPSANTRIPLMITTEDLSL